MSKFLLQYIFISIIFCNAIWSQSLPGDPCEKSQQHAYNKDYKAAIKAAFECLQTSSSPANVYANIGSYYEQLNDFDNALANFSKAISIQPDNPGLHIMRAYFYANRKQFSTALDNINNALALNKDLPSTYLAQGYIHKLSGNIVKAQTSYNEALKYNPKFHAAETALGMIEYEKKNFPVALQHFNRAEPNAYYFSRLYYYRGLIHKHNGDFDLAMKDFNTNLLASSDERNDSTLLHRAQLFAFQGKIDSARMDWKKAADVNPANKNLDEVLVLIKRAEMKQNALSKVSISKNATVDKSYNRAQQLLFERRLDEAFLKIDSAIKVEPNNASLYILSGEILYYLFEEQYDDEIESENADLNIQENDYWNLGVNDLNTAIELDPKNAAAFYWRGAFYIKAKKYKKGKIDWEKSLLLNSSNEDLKTGLEALKKRM